MDKALHQVASREIGARKDREPSFAEGELVSHTLAAKNGSSDLFNGGGTTLDLGLNFALERSEKSQLGLQYRPHLITSDDDLSVAIEQDAGLLL